jgi:hypothetical protein
LRNHFCRPSNLVGYFSKSLLRFSGGLSCRTGGLRPGVSSQASDSFLDFAYRTLRGTFNSILINHWNTSQFDSS